MIIFKKFLAKKMVPNFTFISKVLQAIFLKKVG